MAKIAYYASRIPGKETWVQSDEGYRTYLNVPICRTGSQEYFGRELKKNKGYDSTWGLEDDQKYEVFRPLEEVTHPETIASFETKSVLDEHPSDKIIIDAIDEYDGISKGHAQHVRIGDLLPDGETPLLADLVVKHPDLNLKIENGIRQVSCGYVFILAKDAVGRLIMTKIRGNHIAVVPRGRAGPEVAIGDALPNFTEKRKAPMSFSSRLMRAVGFQNWAKDAKPEEVADALEQLEAEGGADADEHPKGCRCEDCKPAAKDKGAKDRKAAKDAEEKEKEEKAAKDAEAKEAEDKAAKDAAEAEEKAAKDAAEKEEADKAAKDAAEILAPEERSKSEFSVGDALVELEVLRTTVAKSKNPTAIKSYNALTEKMRKVRDGVKDGALEDPFISLVSIGNGAADAGAGDPEPKMLDFFNGVPYAEGVKAYNDYLASKGAK